MDRIIFFYHFKAKQKERKLYHGFPTVNMHAVRYNALFKCVSLLQRNMIPLFLLLVKIWHYMILPCLRSIKPYVFFPKLRLHHWVVLLKDLNYLLGSSIIFHKSVIFRGNYKGFCDGFTFTNKVIFHSYSYVLNY